MITDLKEIHVVGAAIIKGRNVLAAKRSEKMSLPLKWEFPGGKVEKGESHQKALVREVQEELGVEIKVNGYIASGYSDFPDKRIVLHVYEAELARGEPYPKEHAEIIWLDIGRIGELEWAEADMPVCRELKRKYGGIYNQ